MNPTLSSANQDRLWISQTLAGESQAYGYLIDKYKGMLFGLVCRVLKDASQAEDILQDTFVQAYRKLNSFRYESQFSTWIYSIALNGLRNHLRRNRVVKWYSLDAGVMGRDDINVPEIPHKEPSILMSIEKKMDIEAIQRMAASLPFNYQSVFSMHYFQNLPLQEISDRLGKPLGTVKVYLHRSRKMLYKEFQRRATPPISAVSSIICPALAVHQRKIRLEHRG